MRAALAPDSGLRSCADPLARAISYTLARDRRRAPVVRLQCAPSAYSTTHALLEAEAHLADGSHLPLMLKRIDVVGSFGDRPEGKPARVYDGAREALVYRMLLADREPAAPLLYGVVRAEDASPGSWLLLERIRGRELYQFDAVERWEAVASWLAGFHARGVPIAGAPLACRTARLLDHTRPLLYGWHERAVRFAAARGDQGTRRALERLEGTYRRAVDAALRLPRTLLHGDFYPSNILLEETVGSVAVRPVDWELAGLGPGLFDLAALIAGDWGEPARDRIATAYRRALPPEHGIERSAFDRGLAACRLVVAVQWLGWAADWTPPAEHRTDWLTTALNAAVLLETGTG